MIRLNGLVAHMHRKLQAKGGLLQCEKQVVQIRHIPGGQPQRRALGVHLVSVEPIKGLGQPIGERRGGLVRKPPVIRSTKSLSPS